MDTYDTFLQSKRMRHQAVGRIVAPDEIHPMLFPFQRDVVRWAVRKGRAAVFLDTGLGKTFIQLEWARLIGEATLIIAPLSVARQTIREAKKIGLTVDYVRNQVEVKGNISITNYEMIDQFDFSRFGAIVLDESSILKSLSGKTRHRLIDICRNTPFRLACTATPAPNDHIELGNHAEFLGVCSHAEMLALFFINANKEHTLVWNGKAYRRKGSNKGGQEWRLKHHAEKPFYHWLASWAITMTTPSDLGYSDEGFVLPPLEIHTHFVGMDYVPQGQLFFTRLKGITDRVAVRRSTMPARLEKLKELINESDDQWIIWTGLDCESQKAATAISGAIEVTGSDRPEVKAQVFEEFQDGKHRILVTKPRIGGFGMNFQNAHNTVFLGLNDSWETWYQCIRRQWRYGQTNPVNVHVILSDAEKSIYHNIMRKDAMATRLRKGLIDAVREIEKEELQMEDKRKDTYIEDTISGNGWTAMLGDSCVRLRELTDNSVDLSVYSPPFADLYTYTDSERDLGNSRDGLQFFAHYAFIIREILRVTKPGRLTCVHTSDIPAMAQRDGYIGIKDFPGEVIRAHEKEGWIFTGRAFIQKNPQALRNGTPILTPYGWKPIEQLAIGEQVIGRDGKATGIIGVWSHGRRQMYRVTLSDGASIECDAQHQWSVRTKSQRKNHKRIPEWQTIQTDALIASLRVPNGSPRYEIPIVKPVEFAPNGMLPVPPYILGVLLGDGCISQRSTVEFMVEPEIAAAVSTQLADELHMLTRGYSGRGNVFRHTIIGEKWHNNPMLDALRALGIQGKRAWEKGIPENYKTASITERTELLRGLLDTDGTCNKNGQAYFSTTSAQLANDMVELVRSLGGLAGVKTETPTYKYNDEVRTGRLRYLVTVNMPEGSCPFYLTRKAKRWHQKRQLGRWITSIEPTEEAECTCITVDNADGLFVADNYIVTHNSQAIRTKSKALLFVQLRKDSTDNRPALVDQILLFTKPGKNSVPVRPVENGELDNEMWIEWAHGIWLGIHETDTLQYSAARAADDEKHICPLQLGTIERCIKLYSNPGETILTPFMGIGSEAYQAIRFGRRAVGIELKASYFEIAVQNLRRAETEINRPSLFSIPVASPPKKDGAPT